LKNILARAALLAPLTFMAACNATTTASVDTLTTGSITTTGAAIGAGHASWYGPGFQGRRTASGEAFSPSAMTAAHRTLPFGTRVRVVHEETGRSVIVRINDRGPLRIR
jgi:rare lipoprotein A